MCQGIAAGVELGQHAAGDDLLSLERTAEYRGLYHVLGGSLSPLDGVEPENLRIDELLHRVAGNGVQEVVLTAVDEAAELLVIESWHPGRGYERRTRA